MRRQYRDPRPGEVPSWLSMHARDIRNMGNPTGKGEELRFRPSPCCGHDKAENPSCTINTQTGLWRCFKCSTQGNWFTLTRAFGAPLDINDRYAEAWAPVNLDHVDKFATQQRRPLAGGHHAALLKYAHDRGFTDETLNAWRVSTKGQSVLRWPIYAWVDDRWTMVNARMRACLGDSTVRDWFEVRGGPTGLLIGNHLLDPNGTKRALITEGQWDAMAAWQIGFDNVFSVPNGTGNINVASMLRYIPEDWEVWLAMDMDDAGNKAVEQFFAQLGTDRVARLHLPHKDLNDWMLAEPGLTRAQVEATAKGLTKLTTPSASASGGYVDLSLDDAGEEENDIIAFTPWRPVDDFLAGGFRAGQTTGLLAPSGVGKTTWCNQVALFNAGSQITVGVISLEGTRKAFNRKLIDPIKSTWSKQEFEQTVKPHLLISKLEGKLTTVQQCIAEFEQMVAQGAKLLFWDNLDYITQDSSSSQKAAAYGLFIDLCMRHNVHGIAVWQPNKIDRTTVVNSGNQKGYSQMLQDADNYFNLNVIEDFVRLEVEKTRERGVDHQNNKAWFVYDQKTRLYNSVTDMPLHKAKLPGNVVHLHAAQA